ncbi:amidophosphoribosyltransferase [Halalkalibacterium halodurans]|jgi:amidophosphoribosyltransferase|uniref:Amidophosphoribosyltransferase n=2 Tax=Halalkalibacterium halodurans TaxID=86665 RepID=Q9KF56_HALH5|nr:amidophosphoribosyltransferase [Halalkalibacterium halodurans]MDY7221124.1 amidophosphoribosyltransferase [Halalkalibacterium halodurans]MDY7240363.1 amidophosphoribosyltransferase [Halalkalibacterium halodurans]MED3647582.1 amidophosphoribosyltransferase [Halalkalibacterium halodurans]MED4082741.1 amidophosphoribosyltransferase [Halalkalibacterium halodurans]MED4086667.1 amidophosphoribosyltransferase [Halalkalibacterium halodurans]
MFAEIKGLNEECGVFAIWGHEDAAQVAYYGLHSLQHRGQEGAGIVVTDGHQLSVHKGLGLVNDVFNPDIFDSLKGKAAVGHVRYATAGGGGYANVQPLVFRSQIGSLAIAHNGNLVNANHLKNQLENQGSIFQSTSDTEVLAHLIKRSGYHHIREQLKSSLSMLKGAYAFAVMTERELMVALDPNGLRPLSIGRLGEAYVVASETCAFDVIGAEYVREVEPGELVTINDDGLTSERFVGEAARAICSMEYVYFARPDSNVDTINVHTARKNLGKQLAIEAPVEADVVTGVPDSSISAAIGYAEQSGIPYELGLIKNRYVGRTFIQPSQALREQGVKMKLSAVRGVVEGKRVVMIDDSIVRGTTSRRIVNMLREAGAKEVHVRISAPPIKHPCFYGIDTSTKEELIAATHSIEEMRKQMGADSLSFLSLEGLVKGVGRSNEVSSCGQCLACFTGQYPTEIYPDTLHPHDKLLPV